MRFVNIHSNRDINISNDPGNQVSAASRTNLRSRCNLIVTDVNKQKLG